MDALFIGVSEAQQAMIRRMKEEISRLSHYELVDEFGKENQKIGRYAQGSNRGEAYNYAAVRLPYLREAILDHMMVKPVETARLRLPGTL